MSALQTFLYIHVCVYTLYIQDVWGYNQFIATAQSNNFLFVFQPDLDSPRATVVLLKTAAPTHALSKSGVLLCGVQPNGAADNFIFYSEALPGRLDEKQTVQCCLGTV